MSTFPDPYSKCLLESNISELFPSLCGMLADLSWVASTGSAFEPHLLGPGGPSVVPNLDETSCLACETPHPAARTETHNSFRIKHLLQGNSFEQLTGALLLAAVG